MNVVTYDSRPDGIAVITLSRPEKLNAINLQTAHELIDAWRRFEESTTDRVAILTGAGSRAFTAGADIKDPPVGGYGYVPNVGVDVTKPIIAAVSGWCVGVGFALVQMADLCVASDDAVFDYPEPRLGITRGLLGGLPLRIPHKIAMEIMLLGQRQDAERMREIGFVNRVVPSEEVLQTALEMAAIIAAYDGDVSSFLKSAVTATIPKSPGEIAEHTRWVGDSIAGNRLASTGTFPPGSTIGQGASSR
jgi:enoyl-CoA hydratase/carnithine racemase